MQPYNEQPGYTIPSVPASDQPTRYVGNQKDMLAFIAMLAGVSLVASCIPGFSCILPIFALVGGIMGLRGADQAIDPNRTRTYSWVAIITGVLVLLAFVAIMIFYGAVFMAALQDIDR